MEELPRIDVGQMPFVAWPMKFAPTYQKVKTNHKWWTAPQLRWPPMVNQTLRIAVPSPVEMEEVAPDEVPPSGQGGLVGMRVLLASSPPVAEGQRCAKHSRKQDL
ncbi:hypothetical protein V8G54_018512 [Vigna mungo]|uniref:Uncharacterized protein n=1 Tax=Vigna mungo TaxID=3915 RepID=A0AAQ3NAB4_VIGMU